MARVKDPVCGMMIESDSAAGESTFQERTYYFCSQQCLQQFEADPGRYAEPAKPVIADRADNLERHEPPFTKAGGMVAPKFGAAGSGGAEYERLPEAHDDRETR
jgi:YHS domain-containing protein